MIREFLGRHKPGCDRHNLHAARAAGAGCLLLLWRHGRFQNVGQAAERFGAAETIPMDDHWSIIERVRELTAGNLCDHVVEAVGKHPIVCGDTPGFVVNRLLTRMMVVLLDAIEQRRRDREAKRCGGLQIDDELEFRRLLYGQVARLGFLDWRSAAGVAASGAVPTIRACPITLFATLRVSTIRRLCSTTCFQS